MEGNLATRMSFHFLLIQTFTFRLSPIIGYLILFCIFVQFQLAQRELNKELEKLGQERGDLLMEVGKLEQESEVSSRSQRSIAGIGDH